MGSSGKETPSLKVYPNETRLRATQYYQQLLSNDWEVEFSFPHEV